MSRIGRAPISIPGGVTISVNSANVVTVKGKKGELKQEINADIKVSVDGDICKVERPTDQIRHRSLHGLYRSLIANMIVGVTEGYTKELELIGVGYRAKNTGNLLELTVGYSHPIYFMLPDEVKLTASMEKGKTPRVLLESTDKQLIGQIAAKIRAFRSPEPYKGKGIKFVGEIIRRKAGKTSA